MRPLPARPPPRGFTLIEAMIVVAILGILAAIALPAFTPMLQRIQLSRSGAGLAAFVAQIQSRAMADRRCTRVTITGNRLVGEVANVFDCGDSLDASETMANADRIEGGGAAPVWLPVRELVLEEPTLSVAFALGTPVENAGELRFRPSGRVWSADNVITDDDVVLRLTHAVLPVGQNTLDILVKHHGRICELPVGQAPAGGAGSFTCP